MQRGSMTDREAYPTAWITLAVLVLLYLLWRFALGAPTAVSYTHLTLPTIRLV